MQAVICKKDNRVLYLFSDDTRIELTTVLSTPDLVAGDISSATHQIVATPSPKFFVGGGVMGYDGEWSILDKESYDAFVLEAQLKQAGLIRTRRDNLLAASDWTQVLDAQVNQEAWAAYRQALRDIPQQEGFPATVVWPTQPV
jgi:hypothetical protein